LYVLYSHLHIKNSKDENGLEKKSNTNQWIEIKRKEKVKAKRKAPIVRHLPTKKMEVEQPIFPPIGSHEAEWDKEIEPKVRNIEINKETVWYMDTNYNKVMKDILNVYFKDSAGDERYFIWNLH
jgi:hypothetical protein